MTFPFEKLFFALNRSSIGNLEPLAITFPSIKIAATTTTTEEEMATFYFILPVKLCE